MSTAILDVESGRGEETSTNLLGEEETPPSSPSGEGDSVATEDDSSVDSDDFWNELSAAEMIRFSIGRAIFSLLSEPLYAIGEKGSQPTSSSGEIDFFSLQKDDESLFEELVRAELIRSINILARVGKMKELSPTASSREGGSLKTEDESSREELFNELGRSIESFLARVVGSEGSPPISSSEEAGSLRIEDESSTEELSRVEFIRMVKFCAFLVRLGERDGPPWKVSFREEDSQKFKCESSTEELSTVESTLSSEEGDSQQIESEISTKNISIVQMFIIFRFIMSLDGAEGGKGSPPTSLSGKEESLPTKDGCSTEKITEDKISTQDILTDLSELISSPLVIYIRRAIALASAVEGEGVSQELFFEKLELLDKEYFNGGGQISTDEVSNEESSVEENSVLIKLWSSFKSCSLFLFLFLMLLLVFIPLVFCFVPEISSSLPRRGKQALHLILLPIDLLTLTLLLVVLGLWFPLALLIIFLWQFSTLVSFIMTTIFSQCADTRISSSTQFDIESEEELRTPLLARTIYEGSRFPLVDLEGSFNRFLMATRRKIVRQMGLLMFPLSVALLVFVFNMSYSINILHGGQDLSIFERYNVFHGIWDEVMKTSVTHDISLVIWLLSWLPWTQGENVKLFTMAKFRVTDRVRLMAWLEDRDSYYERNYRKVSLDMLQQIDRHQGCVYNDEEGLAVLKLSVEKGADLNFQNNRGETVLVLACMYDNIKCVEWLLGHGANPNIQSVGSETIRESLCRGSTTMHWAARNESIAIIKMLRDYEPKAEDQSCCADFSILDHRGYTPYSKTGSDPEDRNDRDSINIKCFFELHPLWKEEKAALLRDGLSLKALFMTIRKPLFLQSLLPRPSWEEVEAIFLCDSLSLEGICATLIDLIAQSNSKRSRALRRLQLFDMLFCELEGSEEELVRRRKIVFERFLKPALLRSVQEPKIGKELKKLLHFVYEQSAGGPRYNETDGTLREEMNIMTRFVYKQSVGRNRQCDTARSAYQTEFDAVMKKCNASIGALYKGEFHRLQMEDPHMPTLMSYPKIFSNLSEKELNHGSFTRVPEWALRKDLVGALCALKQVGVIESAEMFCELMQKGCHRLLLSSHAKIFMNGPGIDDNFDTEDEDSGIMFWIALVLLWSIGIQEIIQEKFNAHMKAIAGEAFLRSPGVKAFPRSLEKALEYLIEKNLEGWKEQVCAGLHVIDGLRCSFSVETVEENIVVGQRLEATYPVVRTKNGHLPKNISYADRKYNLVYNTKAKGIGEVAFLCEVQILMKRYIEIKKVGHLLYEFQR